MAVCKQCLSEKPTYELFVIIFFPFFFWRSFSPRCPASFPRWQVHFSRACNDWLLGVWLWTLFLLDSLPLPAGLSAV